MSSSTKTTLTLSALGWGSTPEPPYHVAIFTSQQSDETSGFDSMVSRLTQIIRQQPGFLGMDAVDGANGVGIVVSYWKDDESIRQWKQEMEHREAQKLGRSRWLKSYQVRVGRVERAYGFESE